uniref:Uncharacterized protein n=1 Tax=Panagrolaimus sp. JU765 TaxID=591449 RepID=A0AC34QLU4_9BILA
MAKYLTVFLFSCLAFHFIQTAPVTPDRGEGSRPNVFEPRGRPVAEALTAAKDADENQETPILKTVQTEDDAKEEAEVADDSEDKKDVDSAKSTDDDDEQQQETADDGKDQHAEAAHEPAEHKDDVEDEGKVETEAKDESGEDEQVETKQFDDREVTDKNEEGEPETEEESSGVANLTEDKQTGERDAGQEITTPHSQSGATSLVLSSVLIIFVFVF